MGEIMERDCKNPECNNKFTPVVRKQKFCSNKCANRAFILKANSNTEWVKRKNKAGCERHKKLSRNPEYVELRRLLALKNTREVHKYVDEYKMSKGCAHCGWALFSAGLETDHVPELCEKYGKKKGSPRKMSTINSAKRELRKCQILCSLCHTKQTAKRRPPSTVKYKTGGVVRYRAEEKKKVGCFDCGWNETHEGLAWDHYPPHNMSKTASPAYITNLADLKRELEGCQVLCRLCHIYVTQVRKTHPDYINQTLAVITHPEVPSIRSL